jgi:hypothetical protein
MRITGCPAVVKLTLLPHCANSAVPTAAGGTQADTDRHRETQRDTEMQLGLERLTAQRVIPEQKLGWTNSAVGTERQNDIL